MSDYIKREDAIKAIIDAVATYKPATVRISEIPPADVRENVRGEWTYFADKEHEAYWAECSICHKQSVMGGNFCPNCGADMQGEGR